jgi:predicted Zn-dependent peptidase
MNADQDVQKAKDEARLAREAELKQSAAQAMARARSSLQSELSTSALFIAQVVEESGAYGESSFPTADSSSRSSYSSHSVAVDIDEPTESDHELTSTISK